MTRKIFISYRRDNSKYQARQIFNALCGVLPEKHVFMDIDSIPPGHNFRDTLKGWVGECDIMLALIGPGWSDVADPKTGRGRLDNTGDFVRIEIGAALARNIPVVPVLLDGADMPQRKALPRDLKDLVDRQAEHVEFRTFESDVERLIRRLGLLERPTPLARHDPPPSAAPIRLPDQVSAPPRASQAASPEPTIQPSPPISQSIFGSIPAGLDPIIALLEPAASTLITAATDAAGRFLTGEPEKAGEATAPAAESLPPRSSQPATSPAPEHPRSEQAAIGAESEKASPLRSTKAAPPTPAKPEARLAPLVTPLRETEAVPVVEPVTAPLPPTPPPRSRAAIANAVALAATGYVVSLLALAALQDIPEFGGAAAAAIAALVIAGIAIALRWRAGTGAEIALYWFGCLPLVALACVAGLGSDDGGIAGGLFVSAGAAFLSAYFLRRARGGARGRTEAAIYWVGCAGSFALFVVFLAVASRLGGIGLAAARTPDAALSAILFAEIVLIGAMLWRVRGRTEGGEMVIYWFGGTAWTLFFTLSISGLLDRLTATDRGNGLLPALIISVLLCVAWTLFLVSRHRRSARST